MADLTQTPVNVRLQSNTQILRVTAGESVSAGMPAYRLASDGEYYKSGATTAVLADCDGVFLMPAGNGEETLIAVSGDVNLGATLAVGTVYVVSNTAGNIMPTADLSTGEFTTILGVAKSTSVLALDINVSGVSVP